MAGRPHDADEPSARPGDGDPPVGATPGPAEPPAGGHGDDRHPGEEHATGSAEPAPDPGGDADAVAADAPSDAAPSDAALPAPRASADDGDAGPRAPAPGPLSEADVDIDARWRAIVAELGDLGTAPPAGPPRRRATDLPPEPPSALPRAQAPGARTVRPAQPPLEPPTPTGPRAWSPDPDVEEAEDHFQPPDPGPVLGGDPLLTMAWVATVGVPVLLLVAVVVWRDMPSVVLRIAGVAFVGAIALLLWRMPHGRDDDAGPGAVV